MNPQELRIGNIVTVSNEHNGMVVPSGLPFIVFSVGAFKCELLNDLELPWAQQESHEIHSRLIEPIPITPEWLERLGFEITDCEIIGEPRKRSYTTYTKGSIEIDQFEDCDNYPETKFWYAFAYGNDYHPIDAEIAYIHQLQNLYFALTGKELTIKQPAIT